MVLDKGNEMVKGYQKEEEKGSSSSCGYNGKRGMDGEDIAVNPLNQRRSNSWRGKGMSQHSHRDLKKTIGQKKKKKSDNRK